MTPREIAESIAYLDLYTVELADKIEAAIEAALSEREREIARLREALGKYGLHGIDCAVTDPEEDKMKCTCGFDAALSPTGESGTPKDE